MASLMQSAAVDGALWGMRGLPPVRRTVAATIATNVNNHPSVNPRPLRIPRSAASRRIIAVSGMGSRVTTSPIRNRSSNTAHPRSARWCRSYSGRVDGGGIRHRPAGVNTWWLSLRRTRLDPVASGARRQARVDEGSRGLGTPVHQRNDPPLCGIVPDLLKANCSTGDPRPYVDHRGHGVRPLGPMVPSGPCRNGPVGTVPRRRAPLAGPADPRPDVGPEVQHRDRRQRQLLGQGHGEVATGLDRPVENHVEPDQSDPPHP